MTDDKKNFSGGSATAGGMNFQAAVAACVATHVATGEGLQWLSGIVDDVPTSIVPETGGGGDDLAITIRDGRVIEAQVKQGLAASERLWEALLNLAKGLDANDFSFGVLVVCPNSSLTIRKTLAMDILRYADGRTDSVGSLSKKLEIKLAANNIDLTAIATRLRIVTMHCTEQDRSSIITARSQLKSICVIAAQTQAAWDRLYADAASQIAIKGRRTAASIAALLTAGGISLRDDGQTPTTMSTRIAHWMEDSNASLSIKGVPKLLTLDDAWIQVSAIVRDRADERPTELAKAVQQYHSWHERKGATDRKVAAQTIGWFVQHCVVVGGPGMGKSTLSSMLSRRYAQMGNPVLRVSLKLLAARLRHGGAGVEEGIILLGLDGSGIRPVDLATAGLDGWTLVCDGLDETTDQQEPICRGLLSIVSARPNCRVIVTTRPIGYQSPLFENWQHYELQPLDESSVAGNGQILINQIETAGSAASKATSKFFTEELRGNESARIAARSPLLLTLMVSLAIHKIPFGNSRVELYERLFKIYEESPVERSTRPSELSVELATQFLDILAWMLLRNPSDVLHVTLKKCSAVLAKDLERSKLHSHALCELALSYWEDHGIVERLQVFGSETVTFVLQTFGEYAAARFLINSSIRERKKFIARHITDPTWNEVLDFSISLGLANELVEVAAGTRKSNSLEPATLMKCLAAVAQGEPEVGAPLRKDVINMAVGYMSSRSKSDATSVAGSLLQVCNRYPEEVVHLVSGLTEHEYPWTRLAAWAVIVHSAVPISDQTALVEAFRTLADWYRSPTRRALGGGICLSTGGESDLFHAYITGATKYILETLPKTEGNDLLIRVLAKGDTWSMRDHSAVSQLLTDAGRHSVAKRTDPWMQNILLPTKGYEQAERAANTELLKCLRVAIGTSGDQYPLSEKAVLLHLSAFLDVTGYWDGPASDVWKWPKVTNRDDVSEVLRGVLHCTSIPAQRLSAEVESALHALNTSEKKRGFADIWERILHVDASVDLRLTQTASLKIEALERALLHGSDYIVGLAAELLVGVLDSSGLADVLQRLLPVAEGNSFWAAGIIASRAGGRKATPLILARLRDPLTPGCDYLFRVLVNDEFNGNDVQEEIRNGLFAQYVDVAVSAAELLEKRVHTFDEDFVSMLWDAYKYWQKAEQPYPTKDGIVPGSPRAILLRVLLKSHVPTIEELISNNGDQRSDIREIVGPILQNELKHGDEARELFLEAIIAEAISPSLLATALRSKIPFSTQQISKIIDLLQHSNARLRFAAMGLLDTNYLTKEEISNHATELRSDSEGEIQDRAISLQC